MLRILDLVSGDEAVVGDVEVLVYRVIDDLVVCVNVDGLGVSRMCLPLAAKADTVVGKIASQVADSWPGELGPCRRAQR